MSAALALVLAQTLCAARADAPLEVGTPGTFRALFLEQPLGDARGPAGPELAVRWTLANDWSVPTVLARGGQLVQLQNDEQVDALSLRVRAPWSTQGFAARLSSELALSAEVHWGGWSDRLVEGWHALAGYGNFEREHFPRNAVNVVLAEQGGRALVDLHGPVATMGLTARQQLLLAAGHAGAVAARLDLAAPTGPVSRLGHRGGAGLALLASSAATNSLTVHAQAAAALAPELPEAFALQPRRVQASFDASLALRVRSAVLLVEDRLVSPLFAAGWRALAANPDEVLPTATFAALRWNNQLSFGIRWRAATLWLSEDFTPGHVETTGAGWFYNSNAPDLVLGLELRG